MNVTNDTAGHSERPILSIVSSSLFLSAEDIAAAKALADSGIDLTQNPLQQILDRLNGNEQDWYYIHADLAECAIKDLVAAVRNNEIDSRVTAFASVLPEADNVGHFFYRYFKGRCKFPDAKSTKIATFVQARVREGLTPKQIHKLMTTTWRLEDGYREACQTLKELDGKAGDPREPGPSKKERHSAQINGRAPQVSGSGSDHNDPPTAPRSGKRPIVEEEEDEDEGDEAPKKIAKQKPVKILGKPEPLAQYPDEAFARVRFRKNGEPRKIVYLSAEHARDLTDKNHKLLMRRKATQSIRQAAE